MARGTANLIAKLIALILAGLFVIVTVAVLLLVNVQQQLLRPDPYKRALVRQHVYERFPALVAEQIVSRTPADTESGLPEPVRHLSQADYEAILADLLPAAWLQTQAEGAIDQVFSYLDSDEPTTAIRVSLAEVKARVAGEEGVRAALRLVRSWPPCTIGQLAVWAGAGIEEIPACRPPEEILTAFTPQIEELLSDAATRQIPDEISASLPQDDPRPVFRQVLAGARLSPLLPVMLILLVTLFGMRSVKGLLRWWGIPFLIVGLAGIGLAVSALPGTNGAIAYWDIAARTDIATSGLLRAGLDVGRYIVRTFATWIAVEAGAIALLGLVLLGVSRRLTLG